MAEKDAIARLKLPEFPKRGSSTSTGTAIGDPPSGAGSIAASAETGGTPSTTASPFLLSKGLPPVPAKLVELLRDNIELDHRKLEGSVIPKAIRQVGVKCLVGSHVLVPTQVLCVQSLRKGPGHSSPTRP